MKLGIVGGGQLGRMMAEEAKKITGLELEIFVLDPTPDCPAAAFATQVIGDFTEPNTVKAFGGIVDVLTFEIESANATALRELEAAGKAIHPSPQTLSIIKDKWAQKEFLTAHGIPVAPYVSLDIIDDTKLQIEKFAEKHGYPLVLKSRCGAYDGRGNRTVQNESEIDKAVAELAEGLYAEAWVPFERELAVVAARDQSGTVYSYPVAETVHTDHICDTVTIPAEVDETVAAKAESLATNIMNLFHGAGVFGIEMFLLKSGQILINEIAPRVHNSGHGTLGGANVSQFEQHIRAVCGEPLLKPEMMGKVVVMKNILGTRLGPADPQGITAAEALGAQVIIYGKRETKPKRKMGHLTVVGATVEEALAKAHQAHSQISI